MKAFHQVYLVVCLIVLLAACAEVETRVTYPYHATIADINVTGVIAIAVTTQDHRNYVVTETRGPDFVGIQRGGSLLNLRTDSGKALADDMTQSIVNSFLKKGFKAVAVTVAPADNQQTVVEKLKTTGAERFIVLTLTEWKTDAFANIALTYDVKAEIFDRDGKILGTSTINGRDNLGGDGWNPLGYAREAVPKAFKTKLEQLLNSNEIASALN